MERKFYDRFVVAMGEVARRSEADVLIHCAPIDGQLDLYQEILRLPEDLRLRFKSTNGHDTFRGLSTADLVILINAADLYVSTTGGEGFGLNLAEALACEVPVVVTDWAASAEVVGPGGVMIPPLHDSYGEPVRYHASYGMDWCVPDAKAFVEPVLSLIQKPARRRALGAEGRTHVVRSFSWDRCSEQFLSMFEGSDALAAAS